MTRDLHREVETRAAEAQEFHRHLDECRQCRGNPFGLCPMGAALLIKAALDKPQPPASAASAEVPSI